uniref:VWFA domain-containing protein n=1 Tax=Rhabditophanes sp. KR3021 TaxID=114890 RepID=A0AC35UCS4_9BILA
MVRLPTSLLFIFLLWFIQLVSPLTQHTDYASPELDVGMSSLAFVFDRTGSMYDDLQQVRQGARKIFETVMSGDCPEMSLSGIKKALEASLPSSYIYVFTDALSKDYKLESAVIDLIQQKQSSVVFVMTGDCGSRNSPGYQVYEKIAAASFGQVFHLAKSDVNTVLEYVRHSVSQKKVHISNYTCIDTVKQIDFKHAALATVTVDALSLESFD